MSYYTREFTENEMMAAKIALREAGMEPTIENIEMCDNNDWLLHYQHTCNDCEYVRLSIPGDEVLTVLSNGTVLYKDKIDLAVDTQTFKVIKDKDEIYRILHEGRALEEEIWTPIGEDGKYLNMLAIAYSEGYLGGL